MLTDPVVRDVLLWLLGGALLMGGVALLYSVAGLRSARARLIALIKRGKDNEA